MYYMLNEDPFDFPDPYDGERDGLIAIGGDLSIDRLLGAYSKGVFPWYGFKESRYIKWYCPLDRFVILPGHIHVSHSMRTLMNKGEYHVTFDKAFEQVIGNCGGLRYDMPGAWLGKEMTEAYARLHEVGYATSVEVWDSEGKLVGGLYGVTLGSCFFGESMFSLVPSASKLALIHLARHMQENGGIFIDCQFETPHLLSMGGEHISYEKYMEMMRQNFLRNKVIKYK